MRPLKTKLQKTGYVIGIALSAFVLGTLLQFAKAWSEPTVAPPNAEIGAPINVSANYQDKAGAIGSDTGFVTAGSVSAAGAVEGSYVSATGSIQSPQYCIGGSCITQWPTYTATPGDNMGDEIATQDMNMNGYGIYSANYISTNMGYFTGGITVGVEPDADGIDLNGYNLGGANYIEANSIGVAAGGISTTGVVEATYYYDENNTSYFIKPSGTSKMNAIQFSDGSVQTTAFNCTTVYATKNVPSCGGVGCSVAGTENANCSSGQFAVSGFCTSSQGGSSAIIATETSGSVPGVTCEADENLLAHTVTANAICCG